MVSTMHDYIRTHYPNKNVSYEELALTIIFDQQADPYLREAMARSLNRCIERLLFELEIDAILTYNKRVIENIVHELSGDWMEAVRSRRKSRSVNVDLAEWIVGQKAGDVVDGCIYGTAIPIELLGKMVFMTHALKFTLAVKDGAVVVDKAARLNPDAAYRPR